jgi:filamentous hemagglutinin family protein
MTKTSSLLKSSASFLALTFTIGAFGNAAFAGALPSQGKYTAGQGSISKADRSLTVKQSSTTGIIDWKNFSVGKANAISFDNGHGATLNEVTGGNLSRISGALHGTGSVYLINSAGVLITRSGVVNTQGSFAASAGDSDTLFDRKRFIVTGRPKGNVSNEGTIHSGGSVSLDGRYVSDSGTIVARNASLISKDRTAVSGAIHARDNIETSGAALRLSGAKISSRNWLLDPKNLKVTSSAASTIDSSLDHGTNVTLKTTASSASGPGTVSSGPGDITIAASLSWTGTAKLTMDAYHSVIVDDAITAKSKGAVTILTDDGGTKGDLLFGSSGRIDFDNTASALSINGHAYKLEDSISSLESAITLNPSGHFALANDIMSTKTYTSSPISTAFSGTFEGLGNRISGLSINDPNDSYVGLFLNNSGTLRDLNLTNVDIVGLLDEAYVGALAAVSSGTIDSVNVSGTVLGGYETYVGGIVGLSSSGGKIVNSKSSARVSGGDDYAWIGGLAGESDGSISNSSASGDVTGGYYPYIGGLVGENDGTITSSHASGNVNADYYPDAGGLVGYNNGGKIVSSYASGNVNGGYADDKGGNGGLVGYSSDGSITGSYATGDVSGDYEDYSGGLVGVADGTPIVSSHASGNVAVDDEGYGGGLVGYTESGATVTMSHASGTVTGGDEAYLGGLIGDDSSGVSHSYATGAVATGYDGEAGGLVGYEDSTPGIKSSYSKGAVSGGYYSYAGGLVAYLDSGSTISASYASGQATTGYEGYSGGLVAYNDGGTINNSHATGYVFGEYYYEGGLVGYNTGAIFESYATGDVDGTYYSYVGGLAGYNSGSVKRSFATGAVSSDYGYYAGGLIGYNAGTIGNSYATGAVSGYYDEDIGGLVGYNDGSVKDAYSTGYVSGDSSSSVGGFIGDNADTTASDFSHDYWDKSTSATSTGVGSGTAIAALTGKTTSQLKSGLPSGFSSSIWHESSSINGGLPYLKGVTP